MSSVVETGADVTDPAALAALAQVEAGRSAAARRVTTPWWFHPLLGAALAAMLAASSLRGSAVAIVLILSLAAQVGLYALYRRLTGLWVNTWIVPEMRGPVPLQPPSPYCSTPLASAWTAAPVRGAAAVTGVVLGVAYVIYWRWVERRLVAFWSAAA